MCWRKSDHPKLYHPFNNMHFPVLKSQW